MNLQILQPSSREAIHLARVWCCSPAAEFKDCSPLRENISLHKSHGSSSVRLRVLLGSDWPSISGAGRRCPRLSWSSMVYFKLMLRMGFRYMYDIELKRNRRACRRIEFLEMSVSETSRLYLMDREDRKCQSWLSHLSLFRKGICELKSDKQIRSQPLLHMTRVFLAMA